MRTLWTPLGDHVLLEDFCEASESGQRLFLSRLIYESNLIEGIDINPIKTYNEGDVIKPIPEIKGYYDALEYVIKNYKNRSPCQEDIRNIHRTLMTDIWKRDIAYTIRKKKLSEEDGKQLKEKHIAGEYRKSKMWVGRSGSVYYRQLPKIMESLEKKMNLLENASLDDVWNIHHEFETAHPFVDGNGRTGRLLLNWLSLKYLNRFMIIEGRKRGEYYETIQQYTARFKEENPNVGFYKDRK
jgi:Fic family protein